MKTLPVRNSVECGRDGIVRIIKAGHQTQQADLELTSNALRQLEVLRQSNSEIYILFDLRGVRRRNYQWEEPILKADCDALAILGASTITRLIANLLLKRYKQGRPVRYFASFKKATNWLENWRQKQIR